MIYLAVLALHCECDGQMDGIIDYWMNVYARQKLLKQRVALRVVNRNER